MKKKRKINWGNISRIVFAIYIIIGITLLFFSVQIFYTGFHNIDLAYNTCLISNDLKFIDYREISDNYDFGKERLMSDFYNLGTIQIQLAIKTMAISGVFIGIGLLGLLIPTRRENG
ncbi:MAG TPA: hypothetical protein ENI22_02565 [Candidatus Pacearchaeota archaeon]|nr:hypothetical protein [Candidatus Pacearchaeota archaeon]